jgi:hypothetical protein
VVAVCTVRAVRIVFVHNLLCQVDETVDMCKTISDSLIEFERCGGGGDGYYLFFHLSYRLSHKSCGICRKNKSIIRMIF